jgi:ceramide synthetase
MVVKKLTVKFTYSFNEKHAKSRDDPKMHHDRAVKMSKYVFSIFYFSFVTAYGYYLFKDAPWLEWYLGGSGTWEALWEGAPFVVQSPGCMTYCMLQIGYHGGDLVSHLFFEERQNDFGEMMLHHTAAVSLLVSMTFANQTPIGCVVSYLHDIADITVAICKWLSNSYETWAGVFLVINIIVWGYTRIFVFGYIVFRIWTEKVFTCYGDGPFADFWPIVVLSAVMLSALLVLHVFWWFLMFKIIYIFVVKGKAEDVQNEVTK